MATDDLRQVVGVGPLCRWRCSDESVVRGRLSLADDGEGEWPPAGRRAALLCWVAIDQERIPDLASSVAMSTAEVLFPTPPLSAYVKTIPPAVVDDLLATFMPTPEQVDQMPEWALHQTTPNHVEVRFITDFLRP